MQRAGVQAADTTEHIGEKTKHAEERTRMMYGQTNAGSEDVLASVIVPRAVSTRDITVLETAMQGLALDSQHPVALELAATASSRHFLLRATSAMSQRHLVDQVQARYPQAIIRPVGQPDDPLALRKGETPVKRPFTKPKMHSATSVMSAEKAIAARAFASSM